MIDEQMVDRILAATKGDYDPSLRAELKRVADELRRATLHAPDHEAATKMDKLASLLDEASTALGDVTDVANKVLEKVGDKDTPVAVALRDVAKQVNRAARGRWAYL
jgi:hypothetical protein